MQRLKRGFYLEHKLSTMGTYDLLENDARFKKYHYELMTRAFGRYNPTLV